MMKCYIKSIIHFKKLDISHACSNCFYYKQQTCFIIIIFFFLKLSILLHIIQVFLLLDINIYRSCSKLQGNRVSLEDIPYMKN